MPAVRRPLLAGNWKMHFTVPEGLRHALRLKEDLQPFAATTDLVVLPPFAQVAASPARPSALPSELAALTTATLVVPLPRDTRPNPALLTTTLAFNIFGDSVRDALDPRCGTYF